MTTKRDFIKLAASISQVKSAKDRKAQAQQIGKVCAAQNPRFDWQRWNAACKV